MTLLSSRTAYPGVVAILPVLGAVGLVGGASQSGAVSTGLSWSPLVWLGARSYGWYLWHWPLLVLIERAEVPMKLLVAVGALGLAGLTHRFVERPTLRRGGRLA